MMRRLFAKRFLPLAATVVLTSALVCGQSLGDVARKYREKKAASSTPPKVITNADLGIGPDGNSSSQALMQPSAASAAATNKAAAQRVAEQRAAEQWKRTILAQENTIANLRARIEALRASIQFTDPNAAYDYYSVLTYNRYQARQVERLKTMEAQLAGEKQKLEDMQEAARKAGMHTPVYDP